MRKNVDLPDDHTQKIAPESIAKLLTKAAEQLDDGTVAALHRAHDIAMSRYSSVQPVLKLSSVNEIPWLTLHSPRQWMATIVLLAAVLVSAAGYWHYWRVHDLNDHDASHLDIAILTDDLPMEIFVD